MSRAGAKSAPLKAGRSLAGALDFSCCSLFFLFMSFASFSAVIAVFESLLLPLGSLVCLLFCVTRRGWGFDQYLEEANTGKGIKKPRALKPYFQFVLPVLILVILIRGLLK